MPTEAESIALGAIAPVFALADVRTGESCSIESLLGGDASCRGCLIVFACVHCPYVKHVESVLGLLANEFGGTIAFAAISANDVEQYPEDGPVGMRAQAQRTGWHFPYLYDATQQVARAFGAACTPESFLFEREHRLVYHGRIDATRPARATGAVAEQATGADLREALRALVEGAPPLARQASAIGCGIKWRR